MGDSHYAVIAREGALLTVDITDPAAPSTPVTLNHTALHGVIRDYRLPRIGENHYALVSYRICNGIFVFDVTDPARPAQVGVTADDDPGLSTPRVLPTCR